MKWRVPELNDERVIRRFALFPIKAGQEWRWLEFVSIKQSYQPEYLTVSGWHNAQFIER